jgi:hypothetical protein
LKERFEKSEETARTIIKEVYKLSPEEIKPLKTQGYILPKPKLLGSGRRPVENPARVRYRGCAKVGETKFACLNLYDDKREYPSEVLNCLLEVAKKAARKLK